MIEVSECDINGGIERRQNLDSEMPSSSSGDDCNSQQPQPQSSPRQELCVKFCLDGTEIQWASQLTPKLPTTLVWT